ncbi:MAG: response regulator [Thermodesulfobacteriota bacterium]
MKILVAEDYQPNQKLIGRIMESWGIDPVIVSNGLEAVEEVRKNTYDLCIMDINMPVMDGFEATRIIRNNTRYFPIMGISGYERGFDCLNSGMDDFLMKPYKFDKIQEKVIELTVKTINIQYNNGKFEISKETPVDSNHLKELRELDKKGLTKLILRDIRQEFVVHKNVQNKITNDLIGKGLELTEFLDRSEDKPGICHLYKSNLYVTMRCLLPEEFEKLAREEDKILKNAKETSYKISEDKDEYAK